MDELPLNSESIAGGDNDSTDFVVEGSSEEHGLFHGDNPMPPEVGMEFESYDDVYYFYSCFAKGQGFGVRVSNTWYRKSKERYRAKLSCSSAGFKKRSEANRPRPETRTGCPAMIKFRLMENGRWRVIEVELEHNHLISPVCKKLYKSHNKLMMGGAGTKRGLDVDVDAFSGEVQKVRVYHTVVVHDEGNEVFDIDGGNVSSGIVHSDQLQLKEGDAQAIQDFLTQLQLSDSNFFYAVDLNEKGFMRNLFWADSRSRASYHDFGDVVAMDTTCLSLKFEVPLVSFVGVNHHGQSVLMGCGLVAGGTTESYTWVLRAWLTCMSGQSPRVIITDHCQILQAVIADVFPRASHCLYLHSVLMKVEENLRGHLYSEAIWGEFSKTVVCVLRPEEFEVKWEEMIIRYGISDDRLMQALYDDRKRWVPAHVKETFLAGMFPIHQDDDMVSSFFEGYLDRHISLEEFLGKYDEALQAIRQLEAVADKDCKNSSFMLKSRCYFEMQLSRLYTDELLTRFGREIDGMYSCFSTIQVKADSPVITYMVDEQIDGIRSSQTRSFEVVFNAAERDVFCVCGLFNFKGYLCRHAMSVLSQNGVDEIPPQYVVSRWRKDIRRGRVLDHDCSAIDTDKPIQRYNHLYRHIVAVVNEGKRSRNHCEVAIQGLERILQKLQISRDPGL